VSRPALTSRRRGPAAASGASLLLALGACGQEADQQQPADASTRPAVASTQGACAADARPVSLPSAYPSQGALPAGYVVTKVETRSKGRIVVTGVSPKDFAATLADLQSIFSTNGWTLSQGEVEKDDAESNFSGNGFTGRWAIRALDQCAGNTTVSVVTGPS